MTDIGTLTGVVILVQERRFQLADDAGGRHLLLLSESCELDEAELRACADARTRLSVRYRPAPGLIARLATAIEAASPEDPHETPA